MLTTLGIAGCAALPNPAARTALAGRLAQSAGMTKTTLQANGFALVAYQRMTSPGQPLQVYIEGDGLAWISRRQLSDDPTPTDPMALRLAILDPAANVAYLARPCQYLKVGERARCSRAHWSSHRFSEAVIAASDQAIDQLRDRAQAPGVGLIGYSGGGAVAALVAARRDDVISLRTVAGNLDHAAFTRLHKVTALSGSLNPASYGPILAKIPQRHFIGGKDTVIPGTITRAYARRLPSQRCYSVSTVANASHYDGWAEKWQGLLALPASCLPR